MRKAVHYPLPVSNAFGRDANAKRKGRVAGHVWRGSGRWYYETAGDGYGPSQPYRSETAAAQACLVADMQERMGRDADNMRERLESERNEARDLAKAQMDLGMCLDVVCNYRGPCGERYRVDFVAVVAAPVA